MILRAAKHVNAMSNGTGLTCVDSTRLVGAISNVKPHKYRDFMLFIELGSCEGSVELTTLEQHTLDNVRFVIQSESIQANVESKNGR